jgi:hypothetical protein
MAIVDGGDYLSSMGRQANMVKAEKKPRTGESLMMNNPVMMVPAVMMIVSIS